MVYIQSVYSQQSGKMYEDPRTAAAEFGMERLRTKAQEYINELAKTPKPDPQPDSQVQHQSQNHELDESSAELSIADRFPWLSVGYLQLLEEMALVNKMDFHPACKRCHLQLNSTDPAEQSTVIFNRNQI